MAMAHVLGSTRGAVMATVMVRARAMCMRWCEGIGEGKGKGRGEGGSGSTCMIGTRARAHV